MAFTLASFRSALIYSIPSRCIASACFAFVALTPSVGWAADDAAVSNAQFLKSCGVCHTVEPGAELRQGPNLGTVFGRTAGTLSEFTQYSDAMKKAGAGGLVWNEDTLDKWISGAADFIPGSNMAYAQADPAKRKLVIDYLKSLASGTSGAPAN